MIMWVGLVCFLLLPGKVGGGVIVRTCPCRLVVYLSRLEFTRFIGVSHLDLEVIF